MSNSTFYKSFRCAITPEQVNAKRAADKPQFRVHIVLDKNNVATFQCETRKHLPPMEGVSSLVQRPTFIEVKQEIERRVREYQEAEEHYKWFIEYKMLIPENMFKRIVDTGLVSWEMMNQYKTSFYSKFANHDTGLVFEYYVERETWRGDFLMRGRGETLVRATEADRETALMYALGDEEDKSEYHSLYPIRKHDGIEFFKRQGWGNSDKHKRIPWNKEVFLCFEALEQNLTKLVAQLSNLLDPENLPLLAAKFTENLLIEKE